MIISNQLIYGGSNSSCPQLNLNNDDDDDNNNDRSMKSICLLLFFFLFLPFSAGLPTDDHRLKKETIIDGDVLFVQHAASIVLVVHCYSATTIGAALLRALP